MVEEPGGECEGDKGMKDNNILINIERDMDNCKMNVERKFNEEKDYITRTLKKFSDEQCEKICAFTNPSLWDYKSVRISSAIVNINNHFTYTLNSVYAKYKERVIFYKHRLKIDFGISPKVLDSLLVRDVEYNQEDAEKIDSKSYLILRDCTRTIYEYIQSYIGNYDVFNEYVSEQLSRCINSIFKDVLEENIEYYKLELISLILNTKSDFTNIVNGTMTVGELNSSEDNVNDNLNLINNEKELDRIVEEEKSADMHIKEEEKKTVYNSNIRSTNYNFCDLYSSCNILYKFKLPYFKFINSVNKILPYLDVEQRIYIEKELGSLTSRLEDNSLYLGTVGSFSSGKSTFLNSILHKNLLPTDAIQGTTVTTSILKRSSVDDLDIVYTDGSRKLFSQNKSELIKEYFRGSEALSYYNDFELQVDLFKKLISVEEIGKRVNYVTFYYKNEHMPQGIALVDTPGTESLNSRHNEVTKNAIDNICDAIVVIIPQEKPVSEDLIDYINTNLEKQKQEIIFVVTKIEMLGDKDELPMLMKNIKKRLEKYIHIEVKNVIPMPTFVYLKEVDMDMKTNIKAISGMPEDERSEMVKLYEDGIEKIKNILENNRTTYINNRAMNISDNIVNSIDSIVSQMIKKEEEEKKKYKKSIMSVEKFQKRVVEKFEQFRYDMKRCINDEIDNLNRDVERKKLEMQTTSKTCKKLSDLTNVFDFEKIFDEYRVEKYEDITKELLAEMESEYTDLFVDIKEELLNEYGCCNIKNTDTDELIDSSWKISDSEFEKVKNICKEAQKQALRELDVFADKAGKGLSSWGLTFKYILSKSNTVKSISRDFEQITTKMIDAISLAMRDFLVTEISDIIDLNMDIGKENIIYLLKYNKSDIEKYIEDRKQILRNTNSDIQMMEKIMVSINKYKNIIKEAN